MKISSMGKGDAQGDVITKRKEAILNSASKMVEELISQEQGDGLILGLKIRITFGKKEQASSVQLGNIICPFPQEDKSTQTLDSIDLEN